LASRKGIGEVVGSVSMLAVTVALLSGAALVGAYSVRDAASMITASNLQKQRDSGVLVSVIATSSNSTGTFVWLYDFGWEGAPLESVFVNGNAISWSLCRELTVGGVCVVEVAPGSHGQLTIVAGDISIAASV
jgi:hypothetical protein